MRPSGVELGGRSRIHQRGHFLPLGPLFSYGARLAPWLALLARIDRLGDSDFRVAAPLPRVGSPVLLASVASGRAVEARAGSIRRLHFSSSPGSTFRTRHQERYPAPVRKSTVLSKNTVTRAFASQNGGKFRARKLLWSKVTDVCPGHRHLAWSEMFALVTAMSLSKETPRCLGMRDRRRPRLETNLRCAWSRVFVVVRNIMAGHRAEACAGVQTWLLTRAFALDQRRRL